MLVHGFEPCRDTQVYERFWLLVEYKNGARTIECFNGAVIPLRPEMDMSILGRVHAWRLSGKIAKNLPIDLTKFDKAIEKEVMK